MLPLLAASILAGISSSTRMGEHSPGFIFAVDVQAIEALSVEASFSTTNKVETGEGWAARGAVDYWDGPLSVGLGYTRRETSAWHKDVMWARASLKQGRLKLVAQVAPLSDRMEVQVEARLSFAHRWLRLEPRAWVGWHTVAEELGGYAYGLSMIAGWGQ